MTDIAVEFGVALSAQRYQRGVHDRLGWTACATNDRAFDLIDSVRRPDAVAAGQHQPADLEFDMPGAQIDMGLAAQGASGLAAALDISHHIARLDEADHSLPTDIVDVVVGKHRR